MTVDETLTRWQAKFAGGDPVAAQKAWEKYFRRLVRMTRKKLRRRPRAKGEVQGFACLYRGLAAKRYPRFGDPQDLRPLLVVLTARQVYQRAWRKKLRQQGQSPDGPVQFVAEKMDRLLGLSPASALAQHLVQEAHRLLEGLADPEMQALARAKLEGWADAAIAATLQILVAALGPKVQDIRRRWLELDAVLAKPAAAGWRVVLRVTSGPHKGRAFTFAGHDTFLVGRSKHAHFRMPAQDKFFSRIHFLVEVNPPACRLVDLRSRNGTFVNGKKILAADLKNGDRIRAGHTAIRVSLKEGRIPEGRLEATSKATGKGSGKPPLAKPASVPVARPVAKAKGGPCPVCGVNPLPSSGELCSQCAGKAQAHPQPIPGYVIVHQLGRGSLGTVFLALRQANQTRLALKLITPAIAGTQAQIASFLQEAEKLAGLEHPRIAGMRDWGEIKGQLFFAMDYVPGINGEQALSKFGPLPIPHTVGLISQMLETLAFAHGVGFVHRNLKPTNFLVHEEKGQPVVTLTDFGLTRVYQDSAMSGVTLVGDQSSGLAYMAPERITSYREARPAVDQYAAAATLYKLLTGKPIFDLPATFPEQLLMILHDQPVPLTAHRPDVPKELAAIVHQALAQDPDQRFPDVTAFRRALLPFAK